MTGEPGGQSKDEKLKLLSMHFYLWILNRILQQELVPDPSTYSGRFFVRLPKCLGYGEVTAVSKDKKYLEFVKKLHDNRSDVYFRMKVSHELLTMLEVAEPWQNFPSKVIPLPAAALKFIRFVYFVYRLKHCVAQYWFDLHVEKIDDRFYILEALVESFSEQGFKADRSTLFKSLYGRRVLFTPDYSRLYAHYSFLIKSLVDDGYVVDQHFVWSVQLKGAGHTKYKEWLDESTQMKRQRWHDRKIVWATGLAAFAALCSAGGTVFQAWVSWENNVEQTQTQETSNPR